MYTQECNALHTVTQIMTRQDVHNKSVHERIDEFVQDRQVMICWEVRST